MCDAEAERKQNVRKRLLHDGRTCDAIEVAFLHDRPAIKKGGHLLPDRANARAYESACPFKTLTAPL